MTTKNIRVLQTLVIFLGLLIVVGMGVLGTVLSQRIRDPGAATAAAAWQARIDGATVLDVSLDGDRAAIRVQAADGAQRIEIFDTRTGARIGVVVVNP